MKYQLQMVGAATVESRPSVAVVFDSQRYLFNCGEGTQRFLNDRSKTCIAVSGAKTRQMFFTRNSWDCIGGLPGMILTLADAGGKGFTMRGPVGFRHSVSAMRQFLYRPTLPVAVKENTTATDIVYTDENMTVMPVILNPSDATATTPADSQEQVSAESSNANGKRPRHPPFASHKRHQVEESILSKMFLDLAPPPMAAKGKRIKEESSLDGNFHPLSDKNAKHHDVEPQGRAGANRRPNVDRLARLEEMSTQVNAYICKGPKVLGKFDVAAAQALGIPKGKLYGKLQRGESVTLEDGRVIASSQVCSPPKAGAMFIILDCPSTEYILAITSNSQLSASNFSSNPVQLIVHLLGNGILEDESYKAWMNSFGPDTQHIVSGEHYSPLEITLHCTAQIQHDLNCLSDACFPLPFAESAARAPVTNISNLPFLTAASQPLLQYQFEPKRLLDASAVAPSFKTKRTPEDAKFEKYRMEADAVRPSLQFGNPAQAVAANDVVVVPLGTAAAIPGKYRNVSSTYLRFSDMSLFFDAGEGTLGQLYRHYGRERLDAELRMVRCLFISHLHADHHLGSINILKRIHEITRDDPDAQRVCVVGPTRYLTWLSEFADVEELGYARLHLFDSRDFLWNSKHDNSHKMAAFMKETGLSSFQTILVKHCAAAYALVLDHAASGLKIACVGISPLFNCNLILHCHGHQRFSGDCRPSKDFVQVGMHSHLVIHEATLDDEKMQEAIDKNHCTTNEAIDIAKRMKARNLLLTHFSQRYPKLPRLDASKISSAADETGHRMHVGIAFDSMRVRLSEFGQLEALYGPLNTLWGQTAVEDEEVAALAEVEANS
ncbi:beta-lactamase-like protein [Chytriomyces sp. MP71]|nr:beta-lactamase-like protein [Chytriomyces sp. MP71]